MPKGKRKSAAPTAAPTTAQFGVLARCIVPNVWTSAGKMLLNDKRWLSESEIADLDGKVEVIDDEQ